MGWYFHDTENSMVIAVSPRVASTSQRKWYKQLGFPELEPGEAKELQDEGMEVLATIREPIARLKSAYLRHPPKLMKQPFEAYVRERISWDRHIMPQTMLHFSKHGINPDRWRTFEELCEMLPMRENKTPETHTIDEERVDMNDEFLKWVYGAYSGDFVLYWSLKNQTGS